LVNDGYWFHYLEDKIAGYLLSLAANVPAPKIFCCVTDVNDLSACLDDVYSNPLVTGIVVKATNFHSSQGVFVLVTDPNDTERLDLLTGTHMSIDDTVAQLAVLQATKIIVEEFIGTTLPTEYKFHVVNGEIAAIDIIEGRGTDCPCYAVVDTEWNRLDKFGCFEPSGMDMVNTNTQCTEIDFVTGKIKMGPVKKDLYLCDEVPALSPCLLAEMTEIALGLGETIGVYMRVDMFVVDNKAYVQEYSANHMNGLRHCASKLDENGCIDSCFLGRMWDAAGAPYGGGKTSVPANLAGFAVLTPQEQCDLLETTTASTYTSSCDP
jgi:hypothetical protein